MKQQHLHLLHVVGDAGDERRRAERVDLPRREAGDAVEQAGPDVAAEPHRRPRAVVDGADREGDLDQRDREHEQADPPDVGGVARGDAVVDDVGVQARQEEGGQRLQQLQDGHRGQDLHVGP